MSATPGTEQPAAPAARLIPPAHASAGAAERVSPLLRPCPSCGAENPEGQPFCNSCGSPASIGPSPRPRLPARQRATPEVDGRAQAGDRPVRRRHGLHGHGGAGRPGASGVRSCSASSRSSRTACAGSRDGRQVHRRRDHGPVRRADRARGPCRAGLLRGPPDRASSSPSTRPSCDAAKGMNFSVRIGINSGEVVAGAIGDGGRARVHRRRPHRRPRAADGGARRARQGLPHRARGEARRGLSGARATSASSRSRGQAGRSASSSSSVPAQLASRLDLSRGARSLHASSAAWRRCRCSRRRSSERKQGRGGVIGVVAEPGVGKSRLCHEFAERCRAQGLDVYETQAQAHGDGDPLPAGAADDARLLRDRGTGFRAYGEGEDRRPPTAARPRFRRRPPAGLRLPRRPGPGAAGATGERRGAPARCFAV